MHVASWMHSREQIDTYPTIPTDLAQYQKHAEWDLISFTSRRSLVTYFESVLPFVEIYYDIVIQRKPSYYLTTFVLPSFIITTLAITGIFAPFSDAGGRQEKVTMGLTTLLTMAVILNIVTDLMPTSSDGVPLLVITDRSSSDPPHREMIILEITGSCSQKKFKIKFKLVITDAAFSSALSEKGGALK
uniref:Neurotransmitter-gated ion-channel transmembrane domain-containing protein n=1 Tax=Plectus sambesii TaxID=2011161 RepID=A0A914VKT2_9BILA